MYGPHLRKVLREKGRMNISQCENTVQEMVSAPLTYSYSHRFAGVDGKAVSLRHLLKSANLAHLVRLR